jgi:hypothetical protein
MTHRLSAEPVIVASVKFCFIFIITNFILKKSSFLKTQESKKATPPPINRHLQLHRLGASTMEAWIIYDVALHSAGVTWQPQNM